jgi:hypothetical protein
MDDELAAQHPEVRIRLLAMCDVTIRAIVRVRLGMKRVAGGMYAHKTCWPCTASSNACLPCGVMGGFPSVPGLVRSPVVKKNTAACFRKSLESKIRPSLEALTSKSCCSPRTVIACSTCNSQSALCQDVGVDHGFGVVSRVGQEAILAGCVLFHEMLAAWRDSQRSEIARFTVKALTPAPPQTQHV